MNEIFKKIATSKKDQEAKDFQQKENEILNKAKKVEEELLQLRSEKISFLLDVYKDQLISDSSSELEAFKDELEKKMNVQIEKITEDKEKKEQKMQKLKENVLEHIETLKLIIEDLNEKKEELETSFLAGIEYIKREKNQNLVSFKQKLQQINEGRIREFEKGLSKVENL